MKRLVGGCVALAALSLLWSHLPTYDPWSWVIWGREIAHGTLSTTTGPSWKPLPVLFTTPFSLAGDEVAPVLWVVVARAGALLAIAMTYRLASRLAGRGAGVVAAVALTLSFQFLRNGALGNSEGLLVALVLAGVERHLDGRRGTAFALGFAAALLRPEIWLFWVPYGLWLGWRDPRMRLRVGLAFAVIPVLWIVPEWLGSGEPFRAAERAREPLPDSPAFAEHPALEVFQRSLEILAPPVLVFAALAVAIRRPVLRWMAAGSLTLVVTVALMTEAGFSGNLRYVQLPAAIACLLAGVAASRIVDGRALVALPLLAISLPFAIQPVRHAATDLRQARDESRLYASLPDAVAVAGGRGAIDACGGVYTGRFEVPPLTWELDKRLEQVTMVPRPPGFVIAGRRVGMSRDDRFVPVGSTERWVVRRRCF